MKIYFYCSSVTYAMKGRKLLRAEGIGSAVRRAPANMGKRGCGYIIEVADNNARYAITVFDRGGVSYKGIYTHSERGYREVMADDLP